MAQQLKPFTRAFKFQRPKGKTVLVVQRHNKTKTKTRTLFGVFPFDTLNTDRDVIGEAMARQIYKKYGKRVTYKGEIIGAIKTEGRKIIDFV